MFGLVEWTGERHPGCRTAAAGGCRVCRVGVRRGPEWLVRRRCAAAARELRRAGVTRAVFPEDFGRTGEFLRRGVEEVSPLPLYRELAAPWVRSLLAQHGAPSALPVAVCGDRPGPELTRTVTELALHSRYVLLDVPWGGEKLARQLRREYGAPVLLRPEAERLEEAAVLVLFAPRDALRPRGMTLPLYEGGEPPEPLLRLPPAVEESLPEGCCRPQMAWVLRETGILRPGQIEIAGNRAGA